MAGNVSVRGGQLNFLQPSTFSPCLTLCATNPSRGISVYNLAYNYPYVRRATTGSGYSVSSAYIILSSTPLFVGQLQDGAKCGNGFPPPLRTLRHPAQVHASVVCMHRGRESRNFRISYRWVDTQRNSLVSVRLVHNALMTFRRYRKLRHPAELAVARDRIR